MSERVLISVCMTAFQHEIFIEESIQSVLGQEVDADLEVIVGVQPFDNQDKTVDIVYQLAAQYPDIIRVVLLPSNVKPIRMNGRKTGRANFLHTFSFVRGDYVCHLDGDDMYVYKHKLQKQLEFFQGNSELSVVSHAYISERETRDKAVFWTAITKDYSLESVCRGVYFHLSTCMYRNVFKGKLPFDFTLEGTGDYYLLMQYLRFGDGIYIPILGSRYRVHDGGIYSGVKNKVKRNRMIRNLKNYANTGYFDDYAHILLGRAERIELLRKHELLSARKRHFANLLFILAHPTRLKSVLRTRYKKTVLRLLRVLD